MDVGLVGKDSLRWVSGVCSLSIVFVCQPLAVKLRQDYLTTEEGLCVVVGLIGAIGFSDVSGSEFI